MHHYSKYDFDLLVDVLRQQNKSFKVYCSGMNRTTVFNQKRIFTDKTKHKSFKITKRKEKTAFALLSNIKKSFNKYIVDHNYNIPEIKRIYSMSYRNTKLWNQLNINDTFYYVDMKHCYWKIAFDLGIITENLYKKYKNNDEYKLWRNMGLAITTSNKKAQYFENGKLLNEIDCDVSFYKRIYANIRYIAWNNMGNIKDKLINATIGYRVDGIMVLQNYNLTCIKLIQELGFEYDSQQCIKLDHNHYKRLNSDKTIKF